MLSFSGSCNNSLVGNNCGQVDTVDTDNRYCMPGGGYKDSYISCGANCVRPTIPTGPTAQCLAVKAFDTNWAALTLPGLAALAPGQKIRFTVGGTATSGSFVGAKFKINGQETGEITTLKPSETAVYFYEYTIPAGVTSFSVSAKIHHSTLGWSN